ncbi:MAG: multidrug effflux MFS transporter [Waddliaceae bacterium]
MLKNTLFFLLLISVGLVATDIYIPSLPALADYFHTSERTTQMTMFSYLAGSALAPLIFGPISDHIGRKKVVGYGLVIAFFATWICLFALTMSWIILGRLIQGIGTGAVMISARAMIADTYTGKALAKQLSYIAMAMPLILSFAPMIGGFLQETFDWQAVFVFLIGYFIMIFMIAYYRSETLEKTTHKKLSQVFSQYRVHLRNRPFIHFGLGMGFPTAGLYAYFTASPFLFQEVIGLSPSQYGLLTVYIGAVVVSAAYVNARLIHRYSLSTLLWVGSSLMMLAGILMLVFYAMDIVTTWSVLLPTLLFMASIPFSIANSLAKAMSLVKHHFGIASALMTTGQFLLGATGSFLVSVLKDGTSFSLGSCFLIIGIASSLNLSQGIHWEDS